MAREPLPDGVRLVSDALIADGAEVVWLAGGYARGDQARFSDIDLGVIGANPAPMSRVAIDGYFVSISFTTEETIRTSFRLPGLVGGAIPGWRTAVLLHDPHRIGASIQDAAREWSWSTIEDEAGVLVRRQTAVAVELVLKTLNGWQRGDEFEEARQRAALIDCLVRLLSIHRRLLYDSESKLYGAVGAAMGGAWAQAARAALRLGAANPTDSACVAFEIGIEAVRPSLTDEETQLVKIASGAIRAFRFESGLPDGRGQEPGANRSH